MGGAILYRIGMCDAWRVFCIAVVDSLFHLWDRTALYLEFLGHRRSKTTEIYARTSSKDTGRKESTGILVAK